MMGIIPLTVITCLVILGYAPIIIAGIEVGAADERLSNSDPFETWLAKLFGILIWFGLWTVLLARCIVELNAAIIAGG